MMRSREGSNLPFWLKWATRVILPLFIAVVVLGLVCCHSLSETIAVTNEYREAAYLEKKEIVAEETYQKFYQQSFDWAENRYHVSNDFTINIGDIRQIAKLEVLEVSDVEYIIEQKDQNHSNIESWLEVPGTGVFTVDLMTGEYLVDKERRTVVIRVPMPVLENVQIDYAHVEKLLFENDVLNDSYHVGEDLYEKQISDAYTSIYNELSTDPQYYEYAEKSAKLLIENLVKELNSDVPGLHVVVEFMK